MSDNIIKILEDIIYPIVEENANTLEEPENFQKSPNTILFGSGSILDSLGLVTFVVAVEGQIEEKTGIALTLASEKAMSRQKSPFRTIGTLAEYIQELLREYSNE